VAGDPGRSFLLFGWANRNGFVGNYNNVSERFLHALLKALSGRLYGLYVLTLDYSTGRRLI
jgi:hypothetical protein